MDIETHHQDGKTTHVIRATEFSLGNLPTDLPYTPPLVDHVLPIGENHPDAMAVDRFAAAMKAKLAQKRAQGRGGWDDKEDCTQAFLSQLLREHIEKGDPIDVGNLAMMLHQREEGILPAAQPIAAIAQLHAIVDAWEALPGGGQVRNRDVEAWLAEDMSPAINAIRGFLRRRRPDGILPPAPAQRKRLSRADIVVGAELMTRDGRTATITDVHPECDHSRKPIEGTFPDGSLGNWMMTGSVWVNGQLDGGDLVGVAPPSPPEDAEGITITQGEVKALLYGIPKFAFSQAITRLAAWLAKVDDTAPPPSPAQSKPSDAILAMLDRSASNAWDAFVGSLSPNDITRLRAALPPSPAPRVEVQQ